MGSQIVSNAIASWVSQNVPDKILDSNQTMGLRADTGKNSTVYIYWARPFALGASVTSARIVFYTQAMGSATHTITSELLGQSFSPSKMTYKNRPTKIVAGSSKTVTKTGALPDAQEWSIDVTSNMQSVSLGLPWYGFRFTGNETTQRYIYAENHPNTALRPRLEVVWSDAPSKPINLSPGGGRSVSVGLPVLKASYIDVSGSVVLAAAQVQINDTNDFTAPAFDSDWITTPSPEVNLQNTTYPGLNDGQLVYWRIRFMDAAGLPSEWSDATSFKRDLKGTLTLVNPPDVTTPIVEDATPPISWTFSDEQQTAFQLTISETPVSIDLAPVVVFDTSKVGDSTLNGVTTVTGGPVAANINIGYGNFQAGYYLTQRSWNTRIPAQVTLVNSTSGADIFFPVELHEEQDDSFGSAGSSSKYFLAQLKATNPDWALEEGAGGNQALYKPSKYTIKLYKNMQMPGGRQASHFKVTQLTTKFVFDVINVHFRADDTDNTSRDTERKQQAQFIADYTKGLKNVIVTGDFNSGTTAKGFPRDIMQSVGGLSGLQSRGNPTNGNLSSKSGTVGGNWIEDILTRNTEVVTNSAGILTNGASDHYLWLKATVGFNTTTQNVWTGATPTQSTITLPTNVLKVPGKSYTVRVRTWDAKSREATPGDPVYAEVSRVFTFTPNASVTGTNALSVAPQSPAPHNVLTWSRTIGDPDAFNVLRNGVVIATDLDPVAVRVTGTNYTWTDNSAYPYNNNTYSVQAVVNGQASATNPSITVNNKTKGIWLRDPISGEAIVVVGQNAKDFILDESYSVLESIAQGASKALITQSQGNFSGGIDGELATAYGKTAKQWRASFMKLRAFSGRKMYLTTSDYTMLVVAYNFQIVQQVGTSSDSPVYNISFDWLQQESVAGYGA